MAELGRAASAPALRRDPDFRRYLAARIISIVGSVITYFAMPVLVYQLTRSNFWTAVVVVAEAFHTSAGACSPGRSPTGSTGAE